MARKRSAESIDTEIAKVESEMSRLQERYDSLAEKLKSLQDLSIPPRGYCESAK